MNRATDEDARAMDDAWNAYWKREDLQRKCNNCGGSGVYNADECMACNCGWIHDGTEEGAMRAAADTLLSRRMPTREALNAAVARACQDGETYLGIADAIADLFGVTD